MNKVIMTVVGIMWLFGAWHYYLTARHYASDGRRTVAFLYAVGLPVVLGAALTMMLDPSHANIGLALLMAWLVPMLVFEFIDTRRMLLRQARATARMAAIMREMNGEKKADEHG
jgi:hypothetical protein